jgi:hypothetical protein
MRTSDKKRELERAVAAGDASAAQIESLNHQNRRLDGDPYDHLIGKWVFIQGVRQHYRGKLLRATYSYGIGARLFLAPCYDLGTHSQKDPSPDANDAEEALNCTESEPAVVLETAFLTVSRQPRLWPER